MSKLYLIGTGPGSKDYLTLKAFEIVDSVEILVGSKRALDLFPEFSGRTLELRARNMDEMMQKTVDIVQDGYNVAVLSTGDPGFSGVLKPIKKLANNLNIEVLPGISSLQLCAAKLNLPWDDANLLTLHGKGNSALAAKSIDNGKTSIILPDFRVQELARYLLENGVDPQHKVAVCERLSYPDEKIFKGSLEEVADEEFSYLCVMVIY
jgi:cobalt-precorrin-7 (C5)-methyltransferase